MKSEEIEAKKSELQIITKKDSFIDFLSEFHHLFGKGLRIYGLLTNKTINDIKEIFEKYGVNCVLNGEIMYCRWNIKGSNELEFYTFFGDNNVLFIYTFEPASDVYSIERIFRNTSGLYYMWISPLLLDQVKNKIIGKYEKTIISFFTAKRFDNIREKCEIRPGFRRNFRYRGDDGRETLRELITNYGVLPRTIHFKIPTKAEFRVSYKGLITFYRGDMKYVLSIFQYIQENILQTKRIIDTSVYEDIMQKRTYKDLNLQNIVPVSIELSAPLNAQSCSDLIQGINASKEFSSLNEAVIEGSLYFRTTLVDKEKNETLIITSNGRKISVIKNATTSFASILKFFQFVVERFDIDAKISAVS